jgi:cyclopropane-fatty-acyl-phospholipid synthase
MDGRLEDGAAIHNFLLLFSVNRAELYGYGSQKLMRRPLASGQSDRLAAAHARHHYDISTELYRLFLDDQMQYSCAYFRDPEQETLRQAAKKAWHDGRRDWLRLGRLRHSSSARNRRTCHRG